MQAAPQPEHVEELEAQIAPTVAEELDVQPAARPAPRREPARQAKTKALL